MEKFYRIYWDCRNDLDSPVSCDVRIPARCSLIDPNEEDIVAFAVDQGAVNNEVAGCWTEVQEITEEEYHGEF